MNKGLTNEPDDDSGAEGYPAEEAAIAEVAGVKNYITPAGLQRLRAELRFLLTRERLPVTEVAAWHSPIGLSLQVVVSTADGQVICFG